MTQRVEVAVVGGGPGGLSAALAAARMGARVTLIDGQPTPGGQYFRQMPATLVGAGTPRQRQGRALWEKVIKAGAHILLDACVWGVDGDRTLALYGPQAPALLQAEAIILATGAYDRPVAFPGWTLPGVMTAGAARVLCLQRVVPGRRVLLAGSGPLQLVLAAELLRAGTEVVAVLEGARLFPGGLRKVHRMWGQWARLAEGLHSVLTLIRRRVDYRSGWGIVAASGTSDRLQQVTMARLDDQWRVVAGSEQTVACDTLCLGYGFVPFTALARLLGVQMEWRPELGGEVPVRDASMQTSVPGVYAVGDGAGIGGAQLAMVEGQIAGIFAAARLQQREAAAEVHLRGLAPVLAREHRFQRLLSALFTPGPGLDELGTDDTILCRCEDVTLADIRRAVALGADSLNEVKSITRCGMGDCQGRVCSHLIAHAVARATGRPVTQVGLFRARPPVFPVPIGALGQAAAGEAEGALAGLTDA